MRFGRLTAIEATQERYDGKVVWLCKCDCGNYKKVSSAFLTTGKVRSCGCLSVEHGKKMRKQNEEIVRTRSRSNNTTGVTGVSYHKKSGKYRASLSVRGKKYWLGAFDTIEQAKAAREYGERKYLKE